MPNRIPDTAINKLFESEGYSVIGIDRIDGRCLVECICPNKHIYKIRLDIWKIGKRCSFCKRTAIDDYVRHSFAMEGYTVLSKGLISRNVNIDYICPNGHTHSIGFRPWVFNKQRCPVCAGNARLTYEFVKEQFEKEGYTLLSKHYKNNSQKLDYVCPKGHKHSVSWSKWTSGQRCKTCGLIKLKLRQIGSGNTFWKGGISIEPYCGAWADKEYKESIKERDGYKCQNPDCWGKDTRLHIHHIDYDKKNCGPNNLITLCNSCNSRANKDREYYTISYQEIMNKKWGYKYE